MSELFGQASIDHNKEKTALQSFPLFATFFMFFYAWPLWLTNGPPLISTRPPKASDIIHILIPRWFHVMSYLFLQPGSGSNNMILDSKALKCRKKYTCLWKLCKWIVPANITNKKSARCTQSVSRVQRYWLGTYICLIQEGWARKEQTKAPAFPSCSPLQARNKKKEVPDFPSSRSDRHSWIKPSWEWSLFYEIFFFGLPGSFF